MRIYSIIILLVLLFVGCDEDPVSPKRQRMTVQEVNNTLEAYFQIFPRMYPSQIYDEISKEKLRKREVFDYLKVEGDYFYCSWMLFITDDKVISWSNPRETNYYGDEDIRFITASKTIMYFVDSTSTGYDIHAMLQILR